MDITTYSKAQLNSFIELLKKYKIQEFLDNFDPIYLDSRIRDRVRGFMEVLTSIMVEKGSSYISKIIDRVHLASYSSGDEISASILKLYTKGYKEDALAIIDKLKTECSCYYEVTLYLCSMREYEEIFSIVDRMENIKDKVELLSYVVNHITAAEQDGFMNLTEKRLEFELRDNFYSYMLENASDYEFNENMLLKLYDKTSHQEENIYPLIFRYASGIRYFSDNYSYNKYEMMGKLADINDYLDISIFLGGLDSHSYDNFGDWIDEIEDEDAKGKIMRLPIKVGKGKISEEDFNREILNMKFN